jgi:hypothetical protein
MTDTEARMLLDECRSIARSLSRTGDDWESISSDVWMELWQRDITTCDHKLVKRKLRNARDSRVLQSSCLEGLTDYEKHASNGMTSDLQLSPSDLRVLHMRLNGSTLERIRSELGLSRDHLARVLASVLAKVRKDVHE